MYKVKVNDRYDFELTANHQSLQLNGQDLAIDVHQVKEGQLHFIYQNRSYNAEIVSENASDKTMVIKINGKTCTISVEDQFDLLLKELGMAGVTNNKAMEIKAPMPGLVLAINVKEGQEIKKGDSLLVLEAMKMENMLKSTTDGVIRKICVIKGDKVEKNQVLIELV